MTHLPGNDPYAALAQGHDPHVAHGDHTPHGGVAIYVTVAAALLVLTSFSYATHLPIWSSLIGDNVAVKRTWMMAVSCSKAMLVILFFMHLKWEANWKWVLTVPASLMSMLLVLALVPDIGWRMRHASYQRLLYAAEPQPSNPAATAHSEHAEQVPPKQAPAAEH